MFVSKKNLQSDETLVLPIYRVKTLKRDIEL